MLILERPWTTQPQGAVRIDRSNSLAANVQMLLMPINGQLIDIANPSIQWAPGSTAAIKPTYAGMAAALNKDDNSYWNVSGYSNIVGAKGTFAIWAPRFGGSDSNGSVFVGTSSVYFSVISSGIYSFSAQCGSSVDYFNAKNRSIVFTANTSTSSQKAYIDGKLAPGTVSGTPTAWAAGAKTITFGRYASNTTFGVDADIVIAVYTSDVWTESQALSFHQNPWQLFAPLRIYIPTAAAAATVPTLSASTYVPGSLTSTGWRPQITAS